MNARKNLWRPLGKWLGGVIFALFIAFSAQMNLFYAVDNAISDRLYQQEQSLDGNIFVVAIDERSMEEFGPVQTWGRSIIADVIDALNANPEALPAVIGVDMMYYGETDSENDGRLVEAAGRYGNVVTGSSANFKTELIQEDDGGYLINPLAVESLGEPYPSLKAVTKQGHLNTLTDSDGYVRNSIHYIAMPDRDPIPSFAYQIYQTYCERLGIPADSKPPANSRGMWYIPYSAKPGGYNDSFSIVDIISGEIPGEMFADSVVLIGPYATGMRDSYLTPIDRSIPMNGVEIHANVIQALIDGDNFKQHVPSMVQSIAIFLLLILLYFPFSKLAPKHSTPLMLILVIGYLIGVYFLGQAGWMMKVFYLPVGILMLYLFWLAIGYVREQVSRKQMTDTFKRYVAPQVVDEIIKSGANLQIGGQKLDIACLFVDIRGFTPLSESLGPEAVVQVLNESFALTSGAVFDHGGTLDKYIGDATMAIYNAPLPMDDYIFRAVCTAWDIVRGSEKLSKSIREKYGCELHFGIGVNAGPAVVGNIGTSARMDYTAIGDTVNTAARLESQAKSGQVLISEHVYLAVKDKVEVNSLGNMALDGKSEAVHVYELISIKEER